jgi:hypothetical protein
MILRDYASGLVRLAGLAGRAGRDAHAEAADSGRSAEGTGSDQPLRRRLVGPGCPVLLLPRDDVADDRSTSRHSASTVSSRANSSVAPWMASPSSRPDGEGLRRPVGGKRLEVLNDQLIAWVPTGPATSGTVGTACLTGHAPHSVWSTAR